MTPNPEIRELAEKIITLFGLGHKSVAISLLRGMIGSFLTEHDAKKDGMLNAALSDLQSCQRENEVLRAQLAEARGLLRRIITGYDADQEAEEVATGFGVAIDQGRDFLSRENTFDSTHDAEKQPHPYKHCPFCDCEAELAATYCPWCGKEFETPLPPQEASNSALKTKVFAAQVDDMLCDLMQMVNTLQWEWKAENCWSEWDEQTVTKARTVHRIANALSKTVAKLSTEEGK